MDETTVTDQPEAVETESVDTDEVEVNRVDNMSDEEFDAEFEGTETDIVDDPDNETVDNEPKDLDVIYRENLGTDKELDEPLVVKVDGKVYELNSLDEIRNLVERGTKVTAKFTKLADDRRALEEQLVELGETPRVAEDNPLNERLNAIAGEIEKSSYVDAFVADIDQLDEETKSVIGTNPDMLEGLSIDYESGIAQKVMPMVHKLMKVNGLSFEEAYYRAGAPYRQTKEQSAKVEKLKAQPRNRAKVSSGELGRKGIENLSESEFDAYFAAM